MAYINQDMKKALSFGIKEVLKKYGVKATISVEHYSALHVNIKQSNIDFGLNRDYLTVNENYIDKQYVGRAKDFLLELSCAMNSCDEYKNHNNSEIHTDYHDVGWYTNINIGKWDKPYQITKKAA